MDTDANAAYQALKELAAASENSDVVYGYMNIFSKMISHKILISVRAGSFSLPPMPNGIQITSLMRSSTNI